VETKNFGIIGGDQRQTFLAKSLIKDKHNVMVFNQLSKKTEIFKLLENEILVLPFPISRDGICIQQTDIKINDILKLIKNKKIFCGIKKSIKNVNWNNIEVIDYSENEDFVIFNASLTAEGIIKILYNKIERCFRGSNCLITGFGRIGKILTRNLVSLGSKVNVLIHSADDKAWISIFGANPIIFKNEIKYDFIVNTAPELIFDKNILPKVKTKYILDVASMPGGVDLSSAKNLEIKAEQILGIPGKFFPEDSAEIIKQEIYKYLGFIIYNK
jgi:dipicolinate synthase subunit A